MTIKKNINLYIKKNLNSLIVFDKMIKSLKFNRKYGKH